MLILWLAMLATARPFTWPMSPLFAAHILAGKKTISILLKEKKKTNFRKQPATSGCCVIALGPIV